MHDESHHGVAAILQLPFWLEFHSSNEVKVTRKQSSEWQLRIQPPGAKATYLMLQIVNSVKSKQLWATTAALLQ